jgi:hypothetical protein
MPEVFAFATDEGPPVLVELTAADADLRRVAPEGQMPQAAVRFDEALAVIGPTVDALRRRLDRLAVKPEEVTAEFGLRLSAKTSAIIASGTAEAHLKVSLKWSFPSSP